jgi:hypothetical protein
MQYITFFSIMALPVIFGLFYVKADRMSKEAWKRDFVDRWPQTRRRAKLLFWFCAICTLIGPLFVEYPSYVPHSRHYSVHTV